MTDSPSTLRDENTTWIYLYYVSLNVLSFCIGKLRVW